MAFSFNTFATDQKQSAIDVLDTITPDQVRQVGAAYKEGLNSSPKQVINETLESFTGVDLSQGAGIDGLGAQAKNFIEGQAAGLVMQLEQQVLGCINTAIRDLMNKSPELDFVFNFEERINGILGKFRNKLEFKIDAELRKLTYQKIKVHQVALFKQRIRGKIKDICPAATPASVAEVQDFNNKLKGLITERSLDNDPVTAAVEDSVAGDINQAVSIDNTLTTDKINEAEVEVKAQVATPSEGISNNRKKTFQQDPVETGKIVDEKVAETKKEVEEETKKQLEQKDDETIEGLVPTEPTDDYGYVPFGFEDYFTIPLTMIERGNRRTRKNRDYKLTEAIRSKLEQKRSRVYMFIDNGYDVYGDPPWIKEQFERNSKESLELVKQTKKKNNKCFYKITSVSFDGTEVVLDYLWYVFSGEGDINVKQTGELRHPTNNYKSGAKLLVKRIEQEIIRQATNPEYVASNPVPYVTVQPPYGSAPAGSLPPGTIR